MSAAQREALAQQASYQTHSLDGQPVLTFTSTLKAYGLGVGYCRMNYSLSSLNRETWTIVSIFGALLLTMFALMSLLLNLMFSRLVLRPVRTLQNAMANVMSVGSSEAEEGGTAVKEIVNSFEGLSRDLERFRSSSDEIDSLAQSFKQMMAPSAGRLYRSGQGGKEVSRHLRECTRRYFSGYP